MAAPIPSPNTQPPIQTYTRRTRLNPKPNSKYHKNDFVVYTTLDSPITEPRNVKLTLNHPLWHKVMTSEFDALQSNHTWKLVPPNEAQNVVGSHWVFKIKYNPNDLVERLKTLLVAKGFTQRPDIDFSDTFSPVVKSTTSNLFFP